MKSIRIGRACRLTSGPRPERRFGARRLAAVAGLLAACLSGWAGEAAPAFSARFAEGAWDCHAWILVKSPRWNRLGGWVQRPDHNRFYDFSVGPP